jgi:hypothetical protein
MPARRRRSPWVATHTQTGEKLHYQWQKNGTSLPPGGGINDISGSTTTATLSFTNLQGADAGLFDVVVTVTSATYTNSITSVPVPLTVLTLSPLQKANVLGANSGFESNPAWLPWNIFNGCYFATTNAFYDAILPPRSMFWTEVRVALVGANGDRDNGFYHSNSSRARQPLEGRWLGLHIKLE